MLKELSKVLKELSFLYTAAIQKLQILRKQPCQYKWFGNMELESTATIPPHMDTPGKMSLLNEW